MINGLVFARAFVITTWEFLGEGYLVLAESPGFPRCPVGDDEVLERDVDRRVRGDRPVGELLEAVLRLETLRGGVHFLRVGRRGGERGQ